MIKATVLFLAVTAYIPAKPTGATGEQILADITCSVPREHGHLIGKWVHIEGFGVRYVNDVTNRRIKGNIDLAVDSIASAREIGKTGKRRVEVVQ